MSNEIQKHQNKPPRFYWFTGRLYPENQKHKEFIEQTINFTGLQWYGILHDKDAYNEDVFDEEGNILHCKGELKKEHWHILCKVRNAKTLSSFRALLETYDIEPNLFNSAEPYSITRYLTHEEYEGQGLLDKFVYSQDEIIGNKSLYNAYLTEQNSGDDFIKVYNALQEYKQADGLFTLADCMFFMHQRGLYTVIARSYILTRLCETAVKEKRKDV